MALRGSRTSFSLVPMERFYIGICEAKESEKFLKRSLGDKSAVFRNVASKQTPEARPVQIEGIAGNVFTKKGADMIDESGYIAIR